MESFYRWALNPYLRRAPGTGINVFSFPSSQASTCSGSSGRMGLVVFLLIRTT